MNNNSWLKWRYVPFYAMYFLSLFMVALVDLLMYNFSLDRLLSASYISNILTISTANMLVLISTIFFEADKLKETDERVVETSNKLREDIQTKIEVDIKDFIDEDNLGRKIQAWENHIKRKIMKLENKKWTKKREAKIKHLQQKITDEYIDQYIDAIKIKYYYVKLSQIIAGFKTKSEVERFESGFMKIIRDISPRFILSITFPIIIATFSLEMKAFTPALLLSIAAKIVSLLMNYMNGKSYAKVYLDEVVLYNLDYRQKYIARYLAWELQKEKSKAGDRSETSQV